MLSKSVWNIYCFKLWDKVYSHDGLIFIAFPSCVSCRSDDTHGASCPARPHSKLHLPSAPHAGELYKPAAPVLISVALPLGVCLPRSHFFELSCYSCRKSCAFPSRKYLTIIVVNYFSSKLLKIDRMTKSSVKILR